MYSKDLIEKVRELYSVNKSYRKVGSLLKMDWTTVRYMVNNDYSRLKRKRGPKKMITPREERLIKREIKRLQGSNQKVFASKIRTNCKIEAKVRTVERSLKALGLTYKRIPLQNPLRPHQIKRRAQLAEKWIEENLVSQNLVFTDEKRFSFDGPDNWFSWYDPYNPPTRIKRQLGGGSVMVWGATLSTGEIIVQRVDGRVNSRIYTQMLDKYVTPLLNNRFGPGRFFFIQDNCKVHTAKATLSYLKRQKIKLLEWVAYSPDMNIQENVWSMISEKVYDNKQYFSKDSLWQSIQKAVKEINAKEKDKTKNCFNKYNKRLLTLIKNNGGVIPY